MCQEIKFSNGVNDIMLNGSNDKVLINRGVKAVIVPFYQRRQELMHKKTLIFINIES